MLKMGRIEIPGYRTILKNEVFGRRTNPIFCPGEGKDLGVTRVLRIVKFKSPTLEDVIGFIVNNAREIDVLPIGEKTQEKNGSSTNAILRKIPAGEIIRIASEDENVISHLIAHYRTSLTARKNYLSVKKGLVLDRELESALESVEEYGGMAYAKLMQEKRRTAWDLLIQLCKKGKLPESSELRYLAGKRVRESDVFKFRGDLENYKDVARQVVVLERVLRNPEARSELYDSSWEYLDSKSAWLLKETAKCNSCGSIYGIAEKIEKVLKEDVREAIEGKKSPIGRGVGDSEN